MSTYTQPFDTSALSSVIDNDGDINVFLNMQDEDDTDD